MDITFINLNVFKNFILNNIKELDFDIEHYIKQLILQAYTGSRFFQLEAHQTKTGRAEKIHFTFTRYYDRDTDEDIIRIEF